MGEWRALGPLQGRRRQRVIDGCHFKLSVRLQAALREDGWGAGGLSGRSAGELMSPCSRGRRQSDRYHTRYAALSAAENHPVSLIMGMRQDCHVNLVVWCRGLAAGPDSAFVRKERAPGNWANRAPEKGARRTGAPEQARRTGHPPARPLSCQRTCFCSRHRGRQTRGHALVCVSSLTRLWCTRRHSVLRLTIQGARGGRRKVCLEHVHDY